MRDVTCNTKDDSTCFSPLLYSFQGSERESLGDQHSLVFLQAMNETGVKRPREERDVWGSDSSSVSSTSDREDSGDDGNEEDMVNDLLLHVKATARVAAAQPAEKKPKLTAAQLLMTASQKPPGPPSGKRKLSDTFAQINRELLKPLASSNELMVLDAAEESSAVMDGLVSRKVAPPPPEDTKKLRTLKYVDHSTVSYIPLEKEFFIPSEKDRQLSAEEVKKCMKELDGARVSGKDVPPPMATWDGSGLHNRLLETLQEEGFTEPFAVQSIAVPVLMSGRDLILAAKTGSGKTLGYLLPLVRHCLHQPRCLTGEGPIGLILVPTQELAVQVYSVLEKLCAASKLRSVASYGCASLAENIKEAKGGCDVMVATPGRLLDLLTVNHGTSLRLQRVSFVVIDEADRMLDSGFGEHVTAFLKNIRPDRQVALVTATLPKELRKVMRGHLTNPVEVSVGGQATPARNVEQQIFFFDEEVYEVDEAKRKESPRLLKLAKILGEENANGQNLFLIFTQRKEEVDELMGQLVALGYDRRIATLYSGMDPIDRQFALEHFAPGKQFILIATAVAERGLDIPFLEMVINYSMPNHVEAYVHRIGRTGRAGKRGRAASFFRRGVDDDLAPELADALERAEQLVPEELYETASRVREMRREGTAGFRVGFLRGYCKGSHHRLTSRSQKNTLKEAAKASGLQEFLSDSSSNDSDEDQSDADVVQVNNSTTADGMESTALTIQPSGGGNHQLSTLSASSGDRVAKALQFAKKTTDVVTAGDSAATNEGDNIRFQAEYPINDLPDMVRSALQRGAQLRSIAEATATTIVKKGVFIHPRHKHSHRLKEGDQPLYLLIIGKTTDAVQHARRKLNAVKSEATSRVRSMSSGVGAVL